MSISRNLWLLGLAVCVLSQYVTLGVAQQPPTVEQVIEGLDRFEQVFFDSKSMLVRYERTKSEDVMPTQASGGLLPAEWTLAYRDGKWLNERRFTHPTTIGKVKLPVDPKKCIATSGFVFQWEGSGRTAYLCRFDQGMNIYAGLYFTGNLSLDAPRYIATSGGAAKDIQKIRKRYGDDADQPFLPEFLRQNKSRYRVLPEPEVIEGVHCWVVEWPEMDRFCVAVERGFAIPERRYRWGPGKPPKFDIRNSDYREVKPGLWLPFRQIVERYASIVAEKESLWGKVASRSEYRVKMVQFDDVPESVFEVNLPVGTPVYDAVRDFHYMVSRKDEANPFTAAIAQGKILVERSQRRLVIIGVIALLLFLGGASFLIRRALGGKR